MEITSRVKMIQYSRKKCAWCREIFYTSEQDIDHCTVKCFHLHNKAIQAGEDTQLKRIVKQLKQIIYVDNKD